MSGQILKDVMSAGHEQRILDNEDSKGSFGSGANQQSWQLVFNHISLHNACNPLSEELLRMRPRTTLAQPLRFDWIPTALLVRALTLRPSGQGRELDGTETALDRVSSDQAEVADPGTFLLQGPERDAHVVL